MYTLLGHKGNAILAACKIQSLKFYGITKNISKQRITRTGNNGVLLWAKISLGRQQKRCRQTVTG